MCALRATCCYIQFTAPSPIRHMHAVIIIIIVIILVIRGSISGSIFYFPFLVKSPLILVLRGALRRSRNRQDDTGLRDGTDARPLFR